MNVNVNTTRLVSSLSQQLTESASTTLAFFTQTRRRQIGTQHSRQFVTSFPSSPRVTPHRIHHGTRKVGIVGIDALGRRGRLSTRRRIVADDNVGRSHGLASAVSTEEGQESTERAGLFFDENFFGFGRGQGCDMRRGGDQSATQAIQERCDLLEGAATLFGVVVAIVVGEGR